MPEFDVQPLLQSTTVAVHDVCCSGACRHRSDEECAASTQLVFPYRGLYLRHVGSRQSVADANHVLFFNAGEGYQVSHPVAGGDACLSLSVAQPLLCELAPAAMLQRRDRPLPARMERRHARGSAVLPHERPIAAQLHGCRRVLVPQHGGHRG